MGAPVSLLLRRLASLLPLVLSVPWGATAWAHDNVLLERWSVRQWSAGSGLPQSSVLSLEQSHDRFLWIGTFGGLARFDGNSFELFDAGESPLLAGSRILSLMESPDGHGLWIGTQSSGLLLRGGERFRRVLDGDLSGQIWSLAASPGGVVWVGGTRGLFRLTPASTGFTVETIFESSQEGRWRLAHSRAGVWAALPSHGISHFAGGSAVPSWSTPLPPPPDRPTEVEEIFDIEVAPNGSLWVATSRGLLAVTEEGVDVLPASPDSGIPTALARGADETMLVFADRLITRDATGSIRDVTDIMPSPPGGQATSLLLDDEGTVWIGTRGSGLYQIRRRSILRVPTSEPHATRNSIDSMVALPTGGILVAACRNLHRIRDIDTWETRPVGDACLDQLAEHDGDLYGLSRSRPMRIDEGSPTPVGPAGALWIVSGRGGVHRVYPDRWETLRNGVWVDGDLVPREVVPTIRTRPFLLPSGVWFGTDRGIVRVGDDGVRSWQRQQGVTSAPKRWFHEDGDGVVWVATYGGGLLRFAESGLRVYDQRDGLPESFFTGVVETGEGLWLLGNQTLSLIDRRQLTLLATQPDLHLYPKSFRGHDGFREPNGSSLLVDDEDRIWFGTLDGVHVLDTKRRRRNWTPPIPAIQSLWVDGRRVPMDEPLPPLPPLPRNIAIRYAAPSFVEPESIRFRHRLVGFQDQWEDAENRHEVRFTGLPPGTHRFELIAINDEGIRSARTASLEFEVTPAYWQTWWFRLLGGLLTMFLLVAVTRAAVLRERGRALALLRETKQRRSLERERDTLSRQLAQSQRLEALGRLTSGISHDFNNLLLVITANLELARDDAAEPGVRKRIQSAIDAALRGAKVTRQLLTFSRNADIEPRVVDATELLVEMDELLTHSLGERFQLRINIEEPAWLCWADPAALENAILNLLLNARDAMGDGGEILVRLTNRHLEAPPDHASEGFEPGDYLCISVIDEGEGIAPDVLDKVFDPFFTTKTPGRGTGLGLSTVHGFAGQSGGLVNVESQRGRGTTVSLYLRRASEQSMRGVRPEPTALPTRPGHPRILLIEDNDSVRSVTVKMLHSLGYETREAESTAAARALLRSDPLPDLVLSDILLPEETGVEFADWLSGVHPEVPVLLTTGYAPSSLDEGVKRYRVLEKPFSKADLAAALDAVRNLGPTPEPQGSPGGG